MKLQPNTEKVLEKEVNGICYERLPVKTHLAKIKEPLYPFIEKYIRPHIKKGDWIALSEKFVTICQGRVIHESQVKPGLLAKLIVIGVKKYKDDIGYSHPRKMQVAINQAGSVRMFFAMVIGACTRLVGRHGDFYRIAGHRISEIDGFNPAAIPPYNQYAMLGPAEPDKTAEKIQKKLGVPTVIIDGNNINVEVLGRSSQVPVDKKTARLILLDNPMGQGDEMTPIIIVRKRK
ncbi:F420-0--gamma-glutamyl ligase [Candidatus Roizmanbacteria bacterium]|nr:F420-0--gamma-glutamyl ligase [Candidatus Roizmanbacteria bacterium]